MLTTPFRFLFVSTLGYAGALAACDGVVCPELVSQPPPECPAPADTSKPPECPPPQACPAPRDPTPPGYMTCDEWLDVRDVLARDPGVPALCALGPLDEVCDGFKPACAPNETVVVRVFEYGWLSGLEPLPGCVETGTYVCDDQAHVDCCDW